MPGNEVRPSGASGGAEEKAQCYEPSGATLAPSADIQAACEGFVVLVITAAGKYRRRVMLSLHSATAAVQRAQAKGQPAHLVLCKLTPVTAELNAGEWSK